MATYSSILKGPTKQTQPMLGEKMVRNDAGGYSFPIDKWEHLDRFLILGTADGDYYADPKKRTYQSAVALEKCLKDDGIRVVRRIVEVSDGGLASQNSSALFALAYCVSKGDLATKQAALACLGKVARIPTHLFEFIEYCEALGKGWGPALKNAIAKWYTDKPARQLSYHLVKYQSRGGWSNRDVIRLAHPKVSGTQNDILHWAVKGWPDVGADPHDNPDLQIIWAHEQANRAKTIGEVTRLIEEFKLTHEMVPTQWKGTPEFWEAQIGQMPATALIRNLGVITSHCTKGNWNQDRKIIVERLHDSEWLKKSRVHPMALLVASKVYAGGHSLKGSTTWQPAPQIIDALSDAFQESFGFLPQTDKSVVIGVDVSGSMQWPNPATMPVLTRYEAAGALAMIFAKTAPDYRMIAFDKNGYDLPISPRQRLDDVVKTIKKIGGGGTDCAVPMMWATREKIQADAFLVITDAQTWEGAMHPIEAIRDYRKKLNRPAKLITVAMCANQFKLGDDALSLSVVGLDTTVPTLVTNFVDGNLGASSDADD